jgi:alanyl-tRNA synthetase
VSESGIAAGVRRIEAVAGPGMYDLLSARESVVKALALSLKVQPDKLEARVTSMAEEQRKLSAEVERLKVCSMPRHEPAMRQA